MNGLPEPPDEVERVQALDPGRSYLVQAPAGAGKTELLVRRYLRLLALAGDPEEILAVTFTRKAAAEMRRRVMRALTGPASGGELERLAAAVRARDAERGWGLTGQPARLRISTIDALNTALARNAPVSAGSSTLRRVTDQPERLYRLAARGALRLLPEGGNPGNAVANLLRHLDNDPVRAEELLARLLARRDQWLPFIGAGLDPVAARRNLEGSMARLVATELDRVEGLIPDDLLAEASEVVHAAAINRECGLAPGRAPGSNLAARAAWWDFTAGLFLTGEGQWRRAFSVRDGIPPEQRDLKAHASAVAARFGSIRGLGEALGAVRSLPDPHYSAAQWLALESLLTLLPFAAAELKLVFAAEGETDYAEIAAEARAALGEESSPSELALRIDWRLRHILVDEFQDTSEPQYALLRALTRGWMPGDGRTLFLVGDPMQSIYRFRQAEVRLFLNVRDQGLPDLPVDFIRLRTNFRSVPGLVAWVNSTFAAILPVQDDVVSGAVCFAPGAAIRPGEPGEGVVSLHSSPWEAPDTEAGEVIRVVQETLERWPGGDIGILVRSRQHAAPIVAELRKAGIRFAAGDLVQLGRTALAADLLALTGALVHAGDRLAWLTVLRAPWCGLSLADLERLAMAGAGVTLRDVIRDPSAAGGLSADGLDRLGRVAAALERGLSRIGQIPLRDVVEGVWLELGGPAVAGDDLPLADLIFDAIGRHDRGGDCADTLILARSLEQIPASLAAPGARVQVMTIHKAKGLEFDTVILPALGRVTRRDDRPVLLWQELVHPDGSDLLLAPVSASGAPEDRLYGFLWDLRVRQELAEADRLLYVAVTRARERLHLFGQIPEARQPDARPRPSPGSLLDRLWPALGPSWPVIPAGSEAAPAERVTTADAGWIQPPLRRLPTGWQRPEQPRSMRMPPQSGAGVTAILPYDWAGAWSRQAGVVAHRWLQHIALEGLEHFGELNAPLLAPRIRRLLQAGGVGEPALERAIARVIAVLESALEDESGRWVLSSMHLERRNEFPVMVPQGRGYRRLIIDRAFVDTVGVRWIIDYKTGSHEGGDRETFLRSEVERHSPQLRAYRQAFAGLETRPTRTALYFPLLRLLQPVD